ncbi:major facilitator superfamily domain-containing protein 1-like [Pecten maximus]|uniref:major facilitator superfamily domain-containing protein 1-like n=1 Tax=Pecten maximus TaxID=6579 RepID=UPI00145818F3|nr:major facilitator superfamily domain-containing protein 1-like [Pecten maximus]
MESKPIRLTDIKSFPSTYWYLIVMLTCFYSSVIPFVSNATKFFQDRYGFSKTDASYINGAVYDVSLLAPILGKILEKLNCHGIVGMVACLLTTPVYLTLAYLSKVPPLAMSICIGVTFNCNAIILWQVMMSMVPPTSYGTAAGLASSSMGIGMGLSALTVGTILGNEEELIILWQVMMSMVPPTSYGTAAGLASSSMGIGMGLSALTVGTILGNEEETDVDVRLQKYRYMLLLFACLSAVSFLSAVFMNVSDIRSECNINRRLRKSKSSSDKAGSETDPLISDNNSVNR